MESPAYSKPQVVMIRARRLARVIGWTGLREWYSRKRRGYVLSVPDPLDTTPLILSIIRCLPPDLPDTLEIGEDSIASFLDAKVTDAPGFEPRSCFDRLLQDLGPTPDRASRVTCAISRACYLFRADNQRVFVDVLHRFDAEPKMTEDQLSEFYEKLG